MKKNKNTLDLQVGSSFNINFETVFLPYTIDYEFQDLHESLFKLEFLPIFCFLMVTLFISTILLSLSFFLAVQKPDFEKLSTYECGFEPYNDSRSKFSIKFYLFAMIFIIFDIETVFLLPWSFSLSKLDVLGIWSMIDFIFELSFIYLYIWSAGILTWNIYTTERKR